MDNRVKRSRTKRYLPVDGSVKCQFFHKQTDHPLVQQYFSLRQEAYVDMWHLNSFAGEEDGYDYESYILIVSRFGRCLGGARIVVHPDDNGLLPMESPNFKLKELLPEMNLDNYKYGEISRLALDPCLRNGRYSAAMYKLIGDQCRALGLDYFFFVSPVTQSRNLRIRCKRAGLYIKELPYIALPSLETYENNDMRLSAVDLSRDYRLNAEAA